MKKGNAKIISTMLGYEDHGLLTCYLFLESDGCGQGFGGYRPDAPKKPDTILCGFWIRRILETLELKKWEDVKGQLVRVNGEEFGDIKGIGHIIKDKWFYPQKEIDLFLEHAESPQSETNCKEKVE